MKIALDANVISALWSSENSAQMISSRLGDLRTEFNLVVAAPVFAELLAHPMVTERQAEEFHLLVRLRDFRRMLASGGIKVRRLRKKAQALRRRRTETIPRRFHHWSACVGRMRTPVYTGPRPLYERFSGARIDLAVAVRWRRGLGRGRR